MAIQLTQDNITFNNIICPGKATDFVLSKYGYKDSNGNIIDDEYEGNIQEPTTFINAVDIDWNGALVEDDITINSTGDLLSWIKTKGGGTIPTPDPENPDEPTDSSPSIVTLTLDEFNEKLENGLLEEKILYIVVDANGKILFMYQIIDGEGHYTYMPEPQNTGVNSETLTIDEWNNKYNNNQINNNTIYIVTSNDGSMIIAIGNSGVLTNIPVPANGTVVRLTQELYDTKRLNNEIDEGTLYLIVSIANGVEVVTKMYLGTVEVPIGSDATEAIVRSLITNMFSEKITWENDKVKSLNYSIIDVTNPGDFYAKTGILNLVEGYITESGFLSHTDYENSFAEMFAAKVNSDNSFVKKASIIASINGRDESNITINADKIDVNGIFDVKVGDTDKTASELLVTANGLSSRVSGVEDNRVYVSNINLDNNTIDLNVKYTDGNSLAQNASLTLGVDANDSSKIVITADLIILNAEETVADKINALDIIASTINAQQLKTSIADAGYLVIDDNDSSTLTAFTPDGLYFALNKQEIYLNIKDGNTWAAWRTSFDNLFGETSQITNNGLYFYPNGIAEGQNAYGVDIRSIEAGDDHDVASWIHLSDKKGTTYISPTQLISSDKQQTGYSSLWNWTTAITSNCSYSSITPDAIRSTVIKESDGRKHTADVSAYYGEISTAKYNSQGTEIEVYSRITENEIATTNRTYGSAGLYNASSTVSPYMELWDRRDSNVKHTKIGTQYSDIAGILRVTKGIYSDDYIYAPYIIATAKDKLTDAKLEEIVNTYNDYDSLVNSGSQQGDMSTGNVVVGQYWSTTDYNDDTITIYDCGANGISINEQSETPIYLTSDNNPDNYYDGYCLNVSTNHIKFGGSSFYERDDEAIYFDNSAIHLHSKAVAEDEYHNEPLNSFNFGIDSTDQHSYIQGRDLKITSVSYNGSSYGTGTVTIDGNVAITGAINSPLNNTVGSSDKPSFSWQHPDEDENPKLSFGLSDTQVPSIAITASGDYDFLTFNANGFVFKNDTNIHGALKLHNPSNGAKKVEIKYRPITNPDNTLTDYLYVDAWGLIIGSNDSSRIESTDSGTDFHSDHKLFYFDGDVQVNGTVTNSSDRNLKNIVSDITLTAQQVADAPAVNFTWKNDENNINHVGSIAQYWQVVMPEVVKEDKNGNLGLDYSTTALMSSITVAKEVVELKSKVLSLEEENTELKLRLAKIEEKLGL